MSEKLSCFNKASVQIKYLGSECKHAYDPQCLRDLLCMDNCLGGGVNLHYSDFPHQLS